MPYSNGLMRNVVQCLLDYEIPLYLSHTVNEIIGKERLVKIVVARVDEHFQFVPDSEMEFDVDTLLLSVGLIPSNPLLTEIGVAVHPKTGGPLVDEQMQTSFPGVFSCGNSLHVHDLVDFVSLEGAAAGSAAAAFLQGRLNSSAACVKTEPRAGVGYVLPTTLHRDSAEEFTLKFRVSRPFQEVFVEIKQDGHLIKRLKKPYLLPAEMENVKLKASELPDATGTLTVEVVV